VSPRAHPLLLSLLALLWAADATAQPLSREPSLAEPPPPAPQTRRLSLKEALELAMTQQPQLRGAQALVESARSRAEAAHAALLPQVVATAGLQHTAGTLPQPSSPCPRSPTVTDPVLCTFAGVGVTATQLVWDFHQTRDRWTAALSRVEAQEASRQATAQSIRQNVLTHFFATRAQKALVRLARETFAHQERRLALIQGYVSVGTRPESDLAEARTQKANAWVQVISSENAYELAKARLHAMLGASGSMDYEVAEEMLPSLEGEDGPMEPLLEEALRARPEFMGLEHQLRAQLAELKARRSASLPSVSASANVVDRATGLKRHFWNLGAAINLSWPVFDGHLAVARVRETEAEQAATEAQKMELLLQLRLELEQARLAVRGAKATLDAVKPAMEAATHRYRLAEGRYATGVGSHLELAEAQVAWLAAATLKIQAEYSLASARVLLLKALGRMPPSAVTAEAAAPPPF
jgi:outer membrane protein